MNWPFVTTRRYSQDLMKCQQLVKERDRQLAKLGHEVTETKRETGKLLSDLRIVRVQLDMARPRMGKIAFLVEMPESVFDGFRHDYNFRDALTYYIEYAMMKEPEGRKLLAGWYE